MKTQPLMKIPPVKIFIGKEVGIESLERDIDDWLLGNNNPRIIDRKLSSYTSYDIAFVVIALFFQ
ncbi:MAG: hypothetical protein US74_C0010G0006 [Parcubacteria group bacterium GW2011_GWA2_38_13]|nr:MAG: hypothetical protein US74_C0010G0006 [Parcubacteria group bacterium GW2011_GWA2_38_13]